jgi:uncharacterized protein (TIGR04222 family)
MGADLELRRRIERFDPDVGAHPGYFAEKLAYDNGWSRSFAQRVLDEYRRYVYLACTADHVVVPSDEVDMAWHQHLLDTEQYWGEFCQTVLNKPLHHRPNKGGALGQHHHRDLYGCTLRTYERTFGCVPPRDIWPPADDRFGPGPTHGRITLVRGMTGPSRRTRIIGSRGFAGLALFTTVAWAAPTVNGPNAFTFSGLGWNDRTSLVAVALVSVLAVLMSYVLRKTLVGTTSTTAADPAVVAVDPYESAVLNTNTQFAVNVAVAALVRDDALGFEKTTGRASARTYCLVRTGPLPVQSHPLESAVYDAATAAGPGTTLREVHDRVRLDAKRILDSLRHRDLLRRHDRYLGRRCAVACPILFAIVLCGFVIPTTDATTTGTMLTLMAVLVVFAIGLAAAPPHLTALGLDALDAARDEHPPNYFAGREAVVDGRALSWVLALHGLSVLNASLSIVRDAITAPAAMGGGGHGIRSAGCGGGTKPGGGSGVGRGGGCGSGAGCGGGCGGG